ncbi:MAG TPA: hypothetical protein VI408_16035 [Gaiellaceae bacterium]
MMYRSLTQLTAVLMVGLGIAMIAVTLWHGPTGVGLVVGVLFVVAGAGRLWMLRRRS